MSLSIRGRRFSGRNSLASVGRKAPRFRPVVQDLEDRRLMTVTIKIDYSYDTSNFFNTTVKRNIMQLAADILGNRLDDHLSAITPSGSNSWTAQFENPATGNTQKIKNLSVPADTLIVYVGARDLGTGSTAEGGHGAPGGLGVTGIPAWVNLIVSRGQPGALAAKPTDIGSWGGAIAFNSATNWYFDVSSSKLGPKQIDFLSAAIHELGHVLGIGDVPPDGHPTSWTRLVSGHSFLGAYSASEYGSSSVPLNPGNDHWAEGTRNGGFETAMDPTLHDSTRRLFTDLDYAALKDIGWQVHDQGFLLTVAGTGGTGTNMLSLEDTGNTLAKLPNTSTLLSTEHYTSGVFAVYKAGDFTFRALDDGTLVKFNAAGAFVGTQKFTGRVTGLLYSASENVMILGTSDGWMLKVSGTGGTGANMFNVTETSYGFQRTSTSTNYLVGSEQFLHWGVSGIYANPSGIYIALGFGSGGLLKINGTGGTGTNMLALAQDQSGGIVGLSGYHYWVGTQRFIGRITGLIYTGGQTVIGLTDGRMVKINGTGGTGTNMFNIVEYAGGFQRAFATTDNYLVGSQYFSTSVIGLYQAAAVTFIALADGSLLQIKGTGGTGTNMLALQSKSGTITGLPGYNYWIRTQKFSGRVTTLLYMGGATIIGLSDGRMLKVSGTGGTGTNMFNIVEIDGGFQRAFTTTANYLLGSQRFRAGVSGLFQVGNNMLVALDEHLDPTHPMPGF
ncbi:hypothetical protein [Paludisphaera rhizosphaerae]|uniref:hypothetical protein n=1 Tax=Paludisphaera rhizosphaerae TaxID=2711216 RepID=UPI0013ED825B|nr:hypothetical protein [Paludisphaera rhizosphaerae]